MWEFIDKFKRKTKYTITCFPLSHISQILSVKSLTLIIDSMIANISLFISGQPHPTSIVSDWSFLLHNDVHWIKCSTHWKVKSECNLINNNHLWLGIEVCSPLWLMAIMLSVMKLLLTSHTAFLHLNFFKIISATFSSIYKPHYTFRWMELVTVENTYNRHRQLEIKQLLTNKLYWTESSWVLHEHVLLRKSILLKECFNYILLVNTVFFFNIWKIIALKLRKKAWKRRLEWDSNPWPLLYWCSFLAN